MLGPGGRYISHICAVDAGVGHEPEVTMLVRMQCSVVGGCGGDRFIAGTLCVSVSYNCMLRFVEGVLFQQRIFN